MDSAGRGIGERTRGASDLTTVDEDDILAFQDVEGLGRIAVDVHWRAEIRRLRRLEERERAVGSIGRRLRGHQEAAKVDRPTFAGLEHERLARQADERILPRREPET